LIFSFFGTKLFEIVTKRRKGFNCQNILAERVKVICLIAKSYL